MAAPPQKCFYVTWVRDSTQGLCVRFTTQGALSSSVQLEPGLVLALALKNMVLGLALDHGVELCSALALDPKVVMRGK